MSSRIPSFYRIWFTVVDPFLSIIGVYGNLFAPTSILNSYSSSYVSPLTTETIPLLDTTAGFLASLAFLQVALLRAKPTDLTVWRALQGSTGLVGIAMLGGFTRVLCVEGRTDWRDWKVEEWTSLGNTAGVALIRTAFLLDDGMGGEERIYVLGRDECGMVLDK